MGESRARPLLSLIQASTLNNSPCRKHLQPAPFHQPSATSFAHSQQPPQSIACRRRPERLGLRPNIQGASPATAGANRCSRPEQQVGSPATGKAFCCKADLHSAVSKAIDPWVFQLGSRGNPVHLSNTAGDACSDSTPKPSHLSYDARHGRAAQQALKARAAGPSPGIFPRARAGS